MGTFDRDTLEAWLERFRISSTPAAPGVPWTHHQPGTSHGHHVVMTVMIHGNECGTLPAVVRLVEEMRDGWRSDGPVTLVIGNPEAARRNQRFIDSDLNRAWAFVEGAQGVEAERALELRALLDRADLMLDMHQTILESPPFWIFPWDPVFGAWAAVLGGIERGLTRAPGVAFAQAGKLCADEFVRARDKPAFCVELGHKGFDPAVEALADRCMRSLLEGVDRIQRGEVTLQELALNRAPIQWYTTTERRVWDDPTARLRDGFTNWHPVRQGEDLAAPGSPPILAEADGVLLFPKYPAPGPRPGHLYHLGSPIPGTPYS